jgi:hypothetical protein
LDLSGSRLTELPVQGLKKLERLRVSAFCEQLRKQFKIKER